MPMLALEVLFLTGRYAATDFQSRSRAEWPPHPSRLFSAMLAAVHEGQMGDGAREALLWLERQAPPEIWASRAEMTGDHTVFVPVNDNRKATDVLPSLRTRQPRQFPSAVPHLPTVTFMWRGVEAPEALQEIAAGITYLGSSRSLVRVRLLDPPAEVDQGVMQRYRPAAGGELWLRVPAPGRVEELERLYELGLRPTPGLLASYTRANERPAPTPRRGPPEWVLFQRVGGPQLDLVAAEHIATLARDTVLRQAEPTAAALITGGGQTSACAWVPLPFVGSPYADGHLMGLAVLLPPELSGAERQMVLRSLATISSVPIPGLGDWQLGYVPPSVHTRMLPQALLKRRWTEKSRVWSTVTPMVLARFPKRPEDAARQVVAACLQAGLPRPERVGLSAYSYWTGVPPARQFQRRLERRPLTHVTLTFAEQVQGPILLGAGRSLGLGLFRPGKEAEGR